MGNFWDFEAWGFFSVLAVLLASLLFANVLRKTIKPLRDSLVPTSVLGGGILVLVAAVYKWITGDVMFDTAFFAGCGTTSLEMLTYHCLALGFIAATFKPAQGKMTKQRTAEIFNTGITTVASYLLQAVCGMVVALIAALFVKEFFVASGVLLPFGYGQGTGQAMNYGSIYENDYGFVGGKSFGLAVATVGFLVASFGGVLYLSWLKRKNKIVKKAYKTMQSASNRSAKQDEIPLYESMDTLGVQLAFILGSYVITYGIIYVLGEVIPGLKSIMYGFNFLIGVLVATGVKAFVSVLEEKGYLKKHYFND